MRKELMDILACPLCKGNLELKVREEQEEEVITGSLHCDQCQETYPIENSIPNLLPPNLRSD
ncbi:MAG: methytransferase partner Trm112 [Chloroflexi bacterium]|nr:methytransferase partner Trm112 [Chloroflexota bacterium]MCZ6866745.1 methytransferase partner Trm112 [Chloroflexota bacterium]